MGADSQLEFGVPMEPHAWSEASEAQWLASVDIGIMPLPDEPFERGKCGYKLIQYMAAGKPVIASPVGFNRELVTPDVGLLARDAADWLAALRQLGTDVARRQQMGQAGRALVERSYSLQAVAPHVVDLLDSALDE
jgi:glycosyltransferase involved in cell wall biosynthesis